MAQGDILSHSEFAAQTLSESEPHMTAMLPTESLLRDAT